MTDKGIFFAAEAVLDGADQGEISGFGLADYRHVAARIERDAKADIALFATQIGREHERAAAGVQLADKDILLATVNALQRISDESD